MMRILLFLATNVAVMVVAGIVMSLLGVGSILKTNGVDLDLQNLLIICAVFGFTGSIISLLMSKTMAKFSTGTKIIDSPRTAHEKWLLDTVAELSHEAGIKMPEVGIFPAQEANAFATGWNKNDALVAVSEGLLSRFRSEEVRAVLGHEIGHVANGDMVTLTLIQGVVNTFVMFFARIIGHTVDRAMNSNNENSSGYGIAYFVVTMIMEIVFGILASIIVAWFSRKREFRADEAGARLANKDAMISALQRLKQEQEFPSQMPDQLTAFGIRSGSKLGLMALLASHPPLEERIRALREH
ncbi:protease HtpX [Pokkaliibacter sp. CJK22405]|uniref:protease HtpX n=1 Tax=Pokkaliibacter sp. CJK22405 TaxID=3384615 RepID=UPI0039848119